MENKAVADAFKGKILGIRNYESENKEFTTQDFWKSEVLEDFLVEVSTGESDITPAGKAFLEKYYGFDGVAKSLSKGDKFKPHTSLSTPDKIHAWLNKVDPMETVTFIEEARGSIKPGTPLKSDL